jgi:hypothetical protein
MPPFIKENLPLFVNRTGFTIAQFIKAFPVHAAENRVTPFVTLGAMNMVKRLRLRHRILSRWCFFFRGIYTSHLHSGM